MICAEEKCGNQADSSHFICKSCLDKNLGKEPEIEEPAINIPKIIGLLKAGESIPNDKGMLIFQAYLNAQNFYQNLYPPVKAHKEQHPLLEEIFAALCVLIPADQLKTLNMVEEIEDEEILDNELEYEED